MKNYPVKNPETGKTDWVSRSVAVAVSIYAWIDSKFCILANQRGSGTKERPLNHAGEWNVISGFIDYDETLLEACVREVHEETGVDIKDVQLTLKKVDDDPKRENQVILFRYCGFITNAKDIKLTNKYSEKNEVAEIKWIPLDELDNYKWTSENHKNKILEYGEWLQHYDMRVTVAKYLKI